MFPIINKVAIKIENFLKKFRLLTYSLTRPWVVRAPSLHAVEIATSQTIKCITYLTIVTRSKPIGRYKGRVKNDPKAIAILLKIFIAFMGIKMQRQSKRATPANTRKGSIAPTSSRGTDTSSYNGIRIIESNRKVIVSASNDFKNLLIN